MKCATELYIDEARRILADIITLDPPEGAALKKALGAAQRKIQRALKQIAAVDEVAP